MTKKIFLTAFTLGAVAAPYARAAQPVVLNRTLIGASARQLFDALNPDAQPDERGTGKTFRTADATLAVSCRQDADQNTACAVSIDAGAVANGVLVLDGAAGAGLYDALNVPVLAEMVSDVKVFTDSEETVSLLCARSLIPSGDRYACSVELPAR